MTNNDILRSIRYILNFSDPKVLEVAELAGCLVTQAEIATFTKREEDEGYEECPHEVLSCFLDGLIIFKRGEQKDRPRPPLEVPVTNNLVLKKLRVAFSLKDTDIIDLIKKSSSLDISKAEIGAFFRAPGHPNYRECGDQFLRNFLKAITPGVSK